MKIAPLVLFCLASSVSAVTYAQSRDAEMYVGVGARARPAYEGASSNRVDPIPYLRLYGEHFFARTTQGILEGGWRTQPFGGVVFGAQVAYEEGRIADESAFLSEHHLDDLDTSASLGLHAEGDWKLGAVPLNALLRYRQDIDSDNGAQVDLRLNVGVLDWNGVRAALFGQVTWGDSKSTQRYFGITPQQAATSGLTAYGAGSGTRSVQAGLLGDVELAKHWVGLWGITFQQLQGDAANSPLTQDRGNWYVNAGAAYRF
jgi:outer membrane scaffolding protein for murein synthesis (MipA/OmpV family)